MHTYRHMGTYYSTDVITKNVCVCVCMVYSYPKVKAGIIKRVRYISKCNRSIKNVKMSIIYISINCRPIKEHDSIFVIKK